MRLSEGKIFENENSEKDKLNKNKKGLYRDGKYLTVQERLSPFCMKYNEFDSDDPYESPYEREKRKQMREMMRIYVPEIQTKPQITSDRKYNNLSESANYSNSRNLN